MFTVELTEVDQSNVLSPDSDPSTHTSLQTCSLWLCVFHRPKQPAKTVRLLQQCFFCVDLNVPHRQLTDRVVCDSPSLPDATQQVHYVLDFSYQLFLFTNYMFLQVGRCLQACQV